MGEPQLTTNDFYLLVSKLGDQILARILFDHSVSPLLMSIIAGTLGEKSTDGELVRVALQPLLKHAHAEVRAGAVSGLAMALPRMSSEAASAVRSLIVRMRDHDTDAMVRSTAARFVSAWGPILL